MKRTIYLNTEMEKKLADITKNVSNALNLDVSDANVIRAVLRIGMDLSVDRIIEEVEKEPIYIKRKVRK